MQAIENALGRQRVTGNQNAPRLIDIDLLLYGEKIIDSPRLEVPHPRMAQRLFVIKPLLELADIEYYRYALETGDFEGQTLHRLAISS
jgi:2-amino-4-hydroxy-6-hydroxymethyldihydropteridine diphosphokinase